MILVEEKLIQIKETVSKKMRLQNNKKETRIAEKDPMSISLLLLKIPEHDVAINCYAKQPMNANCSRIINKT